MSSDWGAFWAVIGIIIVIGILLIFPICEIWAINTLFNVGIANWQWNTYFAMMVINLVFASRSFKSK